MTKSVRCNMCGSGEFYVPKRSVVYCADCDEPQKWRMVRVNGQIVIRETKK